MKYYKLLILTVLFLSLSVMSEKESKSYNNKPPTKKQYICMFPTNLTPLLSSFLMSLCPSSPST